MFNATHRNRYLYPIEAFSKVIDITSEKYGAVGNYDEDDDAIIHKAITDAKNVYAAQTVFFPQGQWLIKNTLELQGVHVVAAPGAVFKHGSADLDMVRMDTVSSWTGGLFRLKDGFNWTGTCFTIDGTYGPGGYSGENARAPVISNVDILGSNQANCKGIYLYSPAYTPSVGVGGQVTCAVIDRIRMISMGTGIHLFGETDGYVHANHFSNIHMLSFVKAIYLQSGLCNGNFFTNVTLQASSSPQTTAGVVIDGSLNQINNLMCWDWSSRCPTGYGVDISGDNNIVSGIGFGSFCRNTGTGNFIAGVTPRLWGGADLTNDRKAKLSPGTVNNGSSWLSDAISISGAALGDFVLVGSGQSMASVQYYGMVTAANTVKIRMENRSGSNRTFTDNLYWPIRVIPKQKYTAIAAWTPSEIANGGFEPKNITVTGAALGDFVLVSYDQDISSFFMSAAVTATDTVTVTLHNFTGGALTPTAGNVRVRLLKKRGDYFATVNPGTLTAGSGYLKANSVTGISNNGSYVLVAPGVDIVDCMLSGYIYVNAVCSILTNETGGSQTPGSSTWYYRVIEPGQMLE